MTVLGIALALVFAMLVAVATVGPLLTWLVYCRACVKLTEATFKARRDYEAILRGVR